MADGEHLGILKQGVAAWNKWRASNPEIRPNLTAADLTAADLAFADLERADLRGANLTAADLAGAIIVGADLERANLTNASFTSANLTIADLTDAKDLTQEQLNSACVMEGFEPPTLPEGLKPPQKVCGPQTR